MTVADRRRHAFICAVLGAALAAGCSERDAGLPPIGDAAEPGAPIAAAGVQRPRYAIDLSDPFNADSIPEYEGDHPEVYSYIDANIDAHVAALQRWMQQPSISAENVGVREMAELLRDDLVLLGFEEAELVETDGHPGVWGYFDAGAEKTLMVYMMYDVQPVIEEDWESLPFAAELVEKPEGQAIMARGAVNQKGPERAFLNAIESILAVHGNLPVNLMVTAEGEEELGSPHYPRIVDAYEERLSAADAVIFPMSGQRPDGQTNLVLGVKGILTFELEASGGAWGGPSQAEIHGSYKAITDSPVWRLNRALASLVSDDGNTVLVPGFYDDVRPPTAEEQRLIAGYLESFNEEAMKGRFAVQRWIDDQHGVDLLHDLIYTPTLNIDGIWAGYTGPGMKTILPHKATAKLDARLPVGMDPDLTLDRIRAHLVEQGFGDIEVRQMGSYPASQTSADSALVRAVIGVYKRYGTSPTMNPRLAGSAPFYQFTQRLRLPMVPVGLGYGSGAHAPNEYFVVASAGPVLGLAGIERSYVDLLFAFADLP